MRCGSRGSPSELALGVADGTIDWRRLKELGFQLKRVRGGWRGYSPHAAVAVLVGAEQLARGINRYASRPDDLQGWAVTMLSADCFDLAPLERHVAGNLLLDALWDAAETGSVGPTALDVATRLAEEWVDGVNQEPRA
jgi:hypothetical protein